ncbi:hypothetical protein EV714DRAFT_273463 [Schizophyllum commune]
MSPREGIPAREGRLGSGGTGGIPLDACGMREEADEGSLRGDEEEDGSRRGEEVDGSGARCVERPMREVEGEAAGSALGREWSPLGDSPPLATFVGDLLALLIDPFPIFVGDSLPTLLGDSPAIFLGDSPGPLLGDPLSTLPSKSPVALVGDAGTAVLAFHRGNFLAGESAAARSGGDTRARTGVFGVAGAAFGILDPDAGAMQMYEECEALLAVLEIDLSVSTGLPLTRPGTALTMRACEVEKEPLAYEDVRPYADLGPWKEREGRK